MFTVIFHGEAQRTGTLLWVDGIRLVKKESLHTERETRFIWEGTGKNVDVK